MLTLLAGIADRLSHRFSSQTHRNETIDKAMAFRMSHIVDRYRRQEEISEFRSLELERELKRYLAMCALYPRITFPMEGEADGLWHLFLTYTADYKSFCDSVAGRMIHHWPAHSANGRPTADHHTFVRMYRDLFGVLPAPHVWPFMKGWLEQRRARPGHSAAGMDYGYSSGSDGSLHNYPNIDGSSGGAGLDTGGHGSDGGGGGCSGGSN